MAQLVKNPPAMWETWVRSLGWEDPLEKGKATHSSILFSFFYPLQYSSLENSVDCSPLGHKESDMTERLSLSHFTTKQGSEASPGHVRDSGGPSDYMHF